MKKQVYYQNIYLYIIIRNIFHNNSDNNVLAAH